MNIVFTICSNNYLAQAITLGNSLLQHNPVYIFKIGLVDKKNDCLDYSRIPYQIIEVGSIGITRFDEMFKRYSITELNTAVKPFYFQYFFKNELNADNVIYLDPDIFVYQPFTDLDKILEGNEIVITPHFTTPIDDDKFQTENDFLNSGLYNLGFIALKKGQESQKLIDWWAKRLVSKAYVDFRNGMFTDQLWINFVPLVFDKVHIFQHPGYNMAYWNMHERLLTDKRKVVKNNISYPLVFFHFSGFSPLKPETLSKYQDRYSFENRKDIVDLFKNYADKLFENGYNAYVQNSCYYSNEKKRIDLEFYIAKKKSIPMFKRVVRALVLRFILWSKINVDYYTR